MRLFIGIGLAAEAQEALARIREQLDTISDGLRWSQPETWHVTLQFLGHSDETRASCVATHLQTIHAASAPLRLAGLGFFERVGVFYAEVALTKELLALQQFVTAATRACGFVREDRPYSPHVTLARAKGRNGGQALAPLKKAVERTGLKLAAEFVAEEFLLYESFPGPEGSRYEVRRRFPLMPVRE